VVTVYSPLKWTVVAPKVSVVEPAMAETSDAPANLAGRYALFSGEVFFAAGGWNDFKGTFPAADAAVAAGVSGVTARRPLSEWWHVVDLAAGQIVAESEAKPHC
jgi:hypothetical protein